MFYAAQRVKLPRLPFSLLLPLLDLFLWVVVAAIPTTFLYMNASQIASSEPNLTEKIGSTRFPATRDQYIAAAVENSMERTGQVMTAINEPATLAEMLESLPTSWPESWHPQSLELFSWRALTYPLLCLPAWWLVGRSLDALFFSRRLHWPALLTGTIFCLLFIICFFGILLGTPPAPADDGSWACQGLAFWSALFFVSPVAWWLQWRRSRAERETQAAAVSS